MTGFLRNIIHVAKVRRTSLAISAIVLAIACFVACIQTDTSKKTTAIAKTVNQFPTFAGSQACAGCHKDIFEKHIHTAHYLTTRPASSSVMKGNFGTGSNTFAFSELIQVAMEKKDSSYYEVEYDNGIESRRRRIDITIGSGAKGQSYLSWVNDWLYQLPIFYFTAKNEWSNSPGFPGRPIFNRPITSRCLECHSTYAYKISEPDKEPESFERSQMIFGVDCEKCHGPGAQHIAFQQQHSSDSTARFIINPARFTRQQNLDFCRLCHGGRLRKSKPSFSFRPGDTLAQYFFLDTLARDAADIDVHGNQYGLLAASRCFLRSDMTCTTCHNPHENERGKTALFSQRCLNCHSGEREHECKLTAAIGSSIRQNCIDCHMPKQPSKAIVFLEQRSSIPAAASIRSHFIKIYPEESQKILKQIKATGRK